MSELSPKQTNTDNNAETSINNINLKIVNETKIDKIPVGLTTSKGAIPKRLSQKPTKPQQPYISPLRRAKQLQNAVKSFETDCLFCRKLGERIPKTKDKTDILNEAVKHLKEHKSNLQIQKILQEQAPPMYKIGNEKDYLGSKQDLVWEEDKSIPSFCEQIIIPQDMDTNDLPPQTPNNAERPEIIPQDIADEDNFEIAKRITKRKFQTQYVQEPSTSNKYGPLSDLDEEEASEIQENTRKMQSKPKRPRTTPLVQNKATGSKASTENEARKNTRKNKPPPLIIDGTITKNDFAAMEKHLKEKLTKGYSLKITKNNVMLNITDPEQYKQYASWLEKQKELEWHTYTSFENKTHAFILKGLDNEPDEKDIVTDLREQNIEVKKVYPIKTKFRPLYMVVTPANITINTLRRIKYVNHVEVSWEIRRQFTEIIQCRNCYRWGHATSNCHRAIRCPVCSGNHKSLKDNECTNPIKCANCLESHKATDLSCRAYKYKIEKMQEQRQESINVKYKEAPMPKKNAWQERREKALERRRTMDSDDSDDEETMPAKRNTNVQQNKKSANNKSQQSMDNIFSTSMDNTGKNNVSELFNIQSQFRALGNTIPEMLRFLGDFLSIIRKNTKEERAFALIHMMNNLDNYDF